LLDCAQHELLHRISSFLSPFRRCLSSTQADEAAIKAMFDDIADPDDDSVATMEGMYFPFRSSLSKRRTIILASL
jgi:hypothetical protein